MECLKPRYLASREMYVPCGKCGFCANTRENGWSARLHWEYRCSLASAFVGLTYEDKYLTRRRDVPQLVPEDLQKYFKRLRKAGLVFKYYAVGEYGGKRGRPHFHVLFFFSSDFDENIIREKWGMGMVHVGVVTVASVKYCLSYISLRKKRNDRVNEFARMSKGLGKSYLSKDIIAWHKDGRKNYAYIEGKRVALARYYKDKIFSKLDKLRIAVRCEKEFFGKLLRFIRSPRGRKMRDPLAVYERGRVLLAAQMVSSKFKQKQHVSF